MGFGVCFASPRPLGVVGADMDTPFCGMELLHPGVSEGEGRKEGDTLGHHPSSQGENGVTKGFT